MLPGWYLSGNLVCPGLILGTGCGMWANWKLQEPCVSRFEGVFLSGSSWRLIVHSVHASSFGLSVLR